MNFQVEKTHPIVTTIRIPVSGAGWEQWFLLRSDAHHDNAHCDHDLERKHLEEAKVRGAGIMDFGDTICGMQGKWDKRADQSQMREELRGPDYLDRLVSYCADFYRPYAANWVLMTQGNHECLDPETEVLTRRGWVAISEVSLEDEVASLHPLTQQAHFAKPLRTHRYEYEGDMIRVTQRGASMLMTPNHRVAYLSKPEDLLAYRRADELEGHRTPIVPTCGVQEIANDYPLSDDELRLAAWMLTDGSVRNGYTIYQSKPEMVDRICALLDRLGIAYSARTRPSTVREILGRPLKAMPRDQVTFRILKSSWGQIHKLGLGDKLTLPVWAAMLTKRQFDLFLAEIVLGDGTRPRRHPGCATVFGQERFLSSLQAVCVVNGYRASLTSGHRQNGTPYWTLNLVERGSLSIQGKNVSREPYAGFVYCLTTPSGNFMARREGKVFVTGNSALQQRHETNVTERLAERLRAAGSPVVTSSYRGWVWFQFKIGHQRQSISLHYTHGYGGGGPVTRDVIQTARQMVYIDADIMVSGHTHDQWNLPIRRERLSHSGRPTLNDVEHIKCGGYKDEFSSGTGWAIQKGHPPKPLGAYWLRFYCVSSKTRYHIMHDIIRAH